MNSPQSTDSNLTPWCLFWSSWATQFIYFHYSQHTSQIDGIEDCGEQLPYKDINGSLYYFLETLCLFSDQIILRLLFVAYCTHPFFRNREIFLFCFTLHRSNHKFFPPVLSTPPYCPFHFWQRGDFFGFFFPPLIQVITHRVPIDIRVKKLEQSRYDLSLFDVFLLRESSTKSTESSSNILQH